MRVSELVACTGVPLATVKYYLREGLLMPGEATSATQARYGEEHVRRLGLVKALAGAGLPIPRIRKVLQLIDHPDGSLFEVLGQAIGQLPPYLDIPADPGDYPRARAVLEKLGQIYDPRYVAVAQLERARGLGRCGYPDDRGAPRRLRAAHSRYRRGGHRAHAHRLGRGRCALCGTRDCDLRTGDRRDAPTRPSGHCPEFLSENR